MTSKKRLIFSYGILALLLAVLFAANLFWGSVSLTPGAVLAALTGRGRDALSVGIITQLRLPRTPSSRRIITKIPPLVKAKRRNTQLFYKWLIAHSTTSTAALLLRATTIRLLPR